MPAFLLSLREGLEAALIVGIVFGALRKMGRRSQMRFVWLGVAAAAAASLAVAIALEVIGAEFEGAAEQIFEGLTMLLAAGVLTWMIFWMQREGGQIQHRLAADVKATAGEGARHGNLSLFLLAFLSVFREGIELALFLVAARYATSAAQTVAGAAVGLVAAAGLGYLLFAGSLRLNLKLFFRVTSLLLVVFAAGMVASGVHELVEASVLPSLVDPIYNLGGVLGDQAGPGLLLKTLFGYNANPALLETIAYLGYFAVIWAAMRLQRAAQPARATSSG